MIILVILVSCNDNFLNVVPKDQMSDAVFWKTEKDADLALVGCYSGWDGYTNTPFLDAASDNGYEQFNYTFQPIGNGQILPTNISTWGVWCDAQATNWFSYYKIRKYNNFLQKIDGVEMDEAKKNRYKAEVRFLRAYDYFFKVMFWGDMPLVKEVINDPQEASLPRTPKEDIENFILNELTEIAPLLPVQNQIESKGHITKGAALSLKARLELYLGKYTEAQASSSEVIAMACYELFNDYETMFYPENESSNKEAILNVEFVRSYYSHKLPQLNLPAKSGGWSALNASWSLIEAYQMKNGKMPNESGSEYDDDKPFKNRDPRMLKTILCPGEFYDGVYYNPLDAQINEVNNSEYNGNNAAASRGGLLVRKFIKPMSVEYMNDYDGNIIQIRLAEVYLIYAEAALKTGQNITKALGYVNAIRNRSGMPDATALTEDIVKYERRVELAFEGLRYFDIKRWELGNKCLDGALYGSRKGTVNMETGEILWVKPYDYIKLEQRIFYADRNYLLPIPQSEMDVNKNIIQNAGY